MKAMTASAAAKRLGVTRARIYQLIESGRLPAEKFGRDYLIDPASLAAVKNRKPGRPKKQGK